MVSDGWIEGEDEDGKTYYSITGLGRERLGALHDVRMDLMIRMHQGAFLTADIPDDEMHLAHMDHMEVLSALIRDISRLQAEGADPADINGILLKAQKELRKLGKVK
jgi:DNA-binding PadR family transcriptional regulator